MQYNAAQYCGILWHSSILTANTILTSGKFAEMAHPDFFGDNGVAILFTQTQKIGNFRW